MDTTETPTNPVGEATAAAPTGVVDPGTTAPNDDFDTESFDRMPAPAEDDDDGSASGGEAGDDASKGKPAAATDDEVELEIGEGKKVRVPKEVQLGFLRQDDYTRKTQELAEQRRQVEADKAQAAESIKAFRQEHLTIHQSEQALAQLDGQLTEYRKLTPTDWANLRAQDPAGYQQHADNYDFLRRTRATTEDALTAAKTDLTTKEQQLTTSQREASEAATAKAWNETHAVLEKQVEGWNPQRFQAVTQFAVKELGYKPEELRGATDPRPWKMANELMSARAEIAQLKTSLKQNQTAQRNVQAQVVQPAEKPAAAPASTGVKDNLGTSEWMRRRNAQKAKA